MRFNFFHTAAATVTTIAGCNNYIPTVLKPTAIPLASLALTITEICLASFSASRRANKQTEAASLTDFKGEMSSLRNTQAKHLGGAAARVATTFAAGALIEYVTGLPPEETYVIAGLFTEFSTDLFSSCNSEESAIKAKLA